MLLYFGLYIFTIIPTIVHAQLKVPIPADIGMNFDGDADININMIQPRIIDGTEVNPPGKYPFMVIIYRRVSGCF